MMRFNRKPRGGVGFQRSFSRRTTAWWHLTSTERHQATLRVSSARPR